MCSIFLLFTDKSHPFSVMILFSLISFELFFVAVTARIRQKAENIFLHASIKISEIFDIKYLQWSLYIVK